MQEYLNTHLDVYSQHGRRETLWPKIRLIYIGHNKDDDCVFHMIPPEVLVKIEYFVLCNPFVPSSLLEEIRLDVGGRELTETKERFVAQWEKKEVMYTYRITQLKEKISQVEDKNAQLEENTNN